MNTAQPQRNIGPTHGCNQTQDAQSRNLLNVRPLSSTRLFRREWISIILAAAAVGTQRLVAQSHGEAGAQESSIHAFCHTLPLADRPTTRPPTFLLAAIPEVRNIRTRPEFVAAGDTTLAGLRLKTDFVMTALDEIMRSIDVRWTDVTGVQLYTVHDVQALLESLVLPRLGDVARRGIEWHHAHPPVFGNEIEIAVRGLRREFLSKV